jgi:hypothetical protein
MSVEENPKKRVKNDIKTIMDEEEPIDDYFACWECGESVMGDNWSCSNDCGIISKLFCIECIQKCHLCKKEYCGNCCVISKELSIWICNNCQKEKKK